MAMLFGHKDRHASMNSYIRARLSRISRFSQLETRISLLARHGAPMAYSVSLIIDTDVMTASLVQPCRIILSQCPRRGRRPYFPDPPLSF
jgi:hypothetical protein